MEQILTGMENFLNNLTAHKMILFSGVKIAFL